jgi:N-acetylneuraminic acid mutarotase
MKQFVCGIAALALMALSPVKAQNFTWVNGSNIITQSGVYGTIGTPAAANTPGSRTGQVCWKDNSGDFWMFGGEGYDFIGNAGYLNDLWKYIPSTNQWAWIKGNNVISQIGVYGTQGSSAAANKPGSRTGSASWVDGNGTFWMFGGYGWDGISSLGYMNDLWKYNPGNNEWTWVNGSLTTYPTANYGALGVPSSSNVPGPRTGAATWTDNSGNLYLFGGNGTATTTTMGTLNDLWQYNISTNTWTWIKGANNINQNGTYGTVNVGAATNMPGARAFASTWKDASGAFWMMAGDGYDASVPFKSLLNDLWKYDAASNQWTWKGGSNILTQNGSYGTQGVGSTTNIPGARNGAVTWRDAVDNLWLFGGTGLVGTGLTIGQLNDLWKYNVASGQWMWVKGTGALDQPGFYGTINVASGNNRPGGRSNFCSWIDASNNLYLFGGAGFGSGAASDKVNDLWKYTNCYISPITLTVTTNNIRICAGESTSLTAVGGSNYLWAQNSSTLSSIVISPLISTTYSVSTNDANGCAYTATFTQLVDACDNVKTLSQSSSFEVYPVPTKDLLYLNVSSDFIGAIVYIRNLSGQIVQEVSLKDPSTALRLELTKGLYFYEVNRNGAILKSGKLIKE